MARERIKVCSACGHPTALMTGHTGTLRGLYDGVPDRTFTALSCANCGRHFRWVPEPPGLGYGAHPIRLLKDGVRTGKLVWTNDPAEQHLVDPSWQAREVEVEVEVDDGADGDV